MKHSTFAITAALLFATSAQAQVGLTADIGTTGAGAHLVVPVETYLNGRFGVNHFQHNLDKTSGQVHYELKGKLQTFDALFDWYVLPDSKFRVTGGVIYNGTSVKAKANADSLGRFTLNGKTYTAADVGVLSGNVGFRKAAPYLGIGWGNALDQSGSRWQFSADLGAFYQGHANIDLASVGCTTSNQICKALADDVAVERARLTKDVSDFKFYPVLRASLSYRF